MSDNTASNYKDAVHISNRTNGFVNIVSNLNETIKNKFSLYLSNTTLHVDAFNAHLQEFKLGFAAYGIALENELMIDPIKRESYKAMSQLMDLHIIPHMDDGKLPIFDLEKNFFLPFLFQLSKLRLDEKIKPMSAGLSACVMDIKGIKMERSYFSQNVKTVIELYKAQLKELNSVAESIE